MTSQIKMDATVGGICTVGDGKGQRFAMIAVKKSSEKDGEG